MKTIVMDVVGHHFRPEFINRIDEVVVFHPLGKENIAAIAPNYVVCISVLEERGYHVTITGAALEKTG